MGASAAELYLVGFTDNRVDAQDLPQRGEIRHSDIGPAAIVIPDLDPTNALEAMSDTHELLIAVSAQSTVLPVRFGTKVPEDDLPGASSNHRELFDRFVGKCEIRIVATYDEEAVLKVMGIDAEKDDLGDDLETGRRIASALATQRRRDADLMLASLGDKITTHTLSDAKSEWEAFRVSLLAEMEAIDAVEGILRLLAEDKLSHVKFALTAPLPIYSFV